MTFHNDDLSNLRSSSEPVVFSITKPAKLTTSTKGIYAVFFKPLLDVVLILLAAPIILTLLVVSALLVATDGHNPFYTQLRIGKGGRVFRLFKLRTMVPNADALLQAHLASDPEARKEWERSQKLTNDPRITRFGAFLRRTSIDEMPQFLNVLLGDMSLVGPRPFMVNQEHLYPGLRYREVKPGITGLWQISSRNESEFVARAQFDDIYARTLSFGGDIRIIMRTVGCVVRQTGI